MDKLARRNNIERRERPRRPRQTIKVRMIGGPANGKVVEVDAAAEYARWYEAPPMSPAMFNAEEPAAILSGETHNYGRKDFAYRLVSGRTRYWRIMVHEPNMRELVHDIDELVCKAFDTFFGPSIDER